MRSIQLPDLHFSPWYAWEKRSQYPLRRYPGVYLLAIDKRTDLHGKTPSWNDVVYIGMTNSRGGLASRWRQFNRTINGGSGHSGGRTVFLDLGPYPEWRYYLYVAAMGVQCDVKFPSADDYLQMGWVAFYEYEAFAIYSDVVGGHPKYNKK